MPYRNREIRTALGRVETRALSDKEKADGYIGALVGVIPFNTDSVQLRDRRFNNGQPFVERIAPKAFAQASDVMAMAGHSDDTLDAFARQGVNLTIEENDTELRWTALVPNTSAGRDLLELAAKGVVRGTSFEFNVGAEDKWETRNDGTRIRTVTRGTLTAVNPVVWPAYDDSSLSVSMRGGRPGAGVERGNFIGADGSCCVDWWDPSVTPDAKFASWALSRAMDAISNAQEYLRAVAMLKANEPEAAVGSLVDFANGEVAAAIERAKELIDWIAANGTAVNAGALDRAKSAITEARKSSANFHTTDDARERRRRFLNLSSAV